MWIIHAISVLCMLCFRARLFSDAMWSPAGKRLTSWLSFVMSNCEFVTFLLGFLGQVWYLIVSIPDLCPLSYFKRQKMIFYHLDTHRLLYSLEPYLLRERFIDDSLI